ncbi:hypothetical protein RBH29_09735 [Herbivorax sp. ANBcel31]|uniref:hypothetical protein n=1 Tax=Herbivorax sp. ANBcel31 TaxID=3069754 RepID=UPI0027AE5430|nr:hypothetical protein [Herbivorax sp. ANBcel31]MDQ2086705.1 hypothetical protein [Herbivorax sp. ANBcel31]
MKNTFGIINKIDKDNPYKCYKHSKYVNPSSIFILLLMGIAGTLILSAIYSYAIHHLPLKPLNIICTVLFGYLTGLFIGISGKIAKIRNPIILTIIGVVFGLFAVYSSWVIWLFELSQRQEWIFDLSAIFHTMQTISVNGVWSANSYTPTGFLLYIIWFVEATAILGTCVYASSTFIKKDAFCEKCNVWIDTKYVLPNLNHTSSNDKLRNLLHQGQFSALSDLEVQNQPSNLFTMVELSKCSKCNEIYLLTVKAVEIIKSSNGNFSRDETTIVQNMIIDDEIYDSIKSWGEKRA